MPHWVLRALGMAVLHAAATVALAKIAVFQPGETTLARSAALALLVGAAALWSALDGWARRPDGGRTWFIAGLVAGPAAGVLGVVGKAVLVDRTGVSELGAALTSGAAFTALLVLVPAGLGLVVGSRLPRPGSDLDGDDGDGATGSAAAIGAAAAADTPGAAESPAAGSAAPTPAGRDERNETVLLAKPRPDRRPRPTPRLRARRGDRVAADGDDTGR
ncbi:hypothetical protein LY13_002732 [Prauserella aidingensis]|uniref:B-4DMT family transporter n=1 Tax=Prauserella aidingensis TaxID=387890 RepID=UPI0027E34023|nr:B-4DMT family transporter [Prauserella aidingensis]MCP2253974.1 hypothetical protein [Prauserella aidingensis]